MRLIGTRDRRPVGSLSGLLILILLSGCTSLVAGQASPAPTTSGSPPTTANPTAAPK